MEIFEYMLETEKSALKRYRDLTFANGTHDRSSGTKIDDSKNEITNFFFTQLQIMQEIQMAQLKGLKVIADQLVELNKTVEGLKSNQKSMQT